MDNQELNTKIEELKKEIENLKRVLESHTHSGNDGSSYIYQDSVRQKTQQSYQIGSFAMTEYSGIPDEDSSFLQRGFLVVGTDEISQDGYDNAQLTLEHQPTTNESSNQTFFYGYRGKLYAGNKGKVEMDGNKLFQKEFEFKPAALIGLFVNFKYGDNVTETYEITANDKNTITINGTWTTTKSEGKFFIFMPIYLGAAQYPWRRLYTLNGVDGGVRFGVGSTGNTQNSHLYFKDTKMIMRYNDAGTTRYKYLDLTGTGVTWVHTTTAP